jgi:hypothetical protein
MHIYKLIDSYPQPGSSQGYSNHLASHKLKSINIKNTQGRDPTFVWMGKSSIGIKALELTDGETFPRKKEIYRVNEI